MMLTLFKQLGQVLAWFVVVAPWEKAIRVRFGKHVRPLEAGIYFKIPFVDRVFKQSTRRRLKLLRPQTLTTLDKRVVTCAGAIGFSIGDLRKLYDTLESPNDTIENEVAGLVAKFVGGRLLANCGWAELQAFVMGSLDLTKYGLEGQEFYLTSFAASKTYRFITGGMDSWSHDSQMSMAETTNEPR